MTTASDLGAALHALIERGVITLGADGTIRLTQRAMNNMVKEPTMHFVGFKDDRWWNAVKTFGKPDFIHRHWDRRAVAEVCEGDIVVFAKGDEHETPCEFAYDDSAHF
jgi:hypothetical protein